MPVEHKGYGERIKQQGIIPWGVNKFLSTYYKIYYGSILPFWKPLKSSSKANESLGINFHGNVKKNSNFKFSVPGSPRSNTP